MKRMKIWLLGVGLLSMLCAGSAMTEGVGELDATFGEDGRVATALNQFGDQAYALAVQPDGRILAGGSSSNGANLDFALVRYTEDGLLDQSFNLDGTVTTMIGREDDEVAALAVQDDGYIVAVGYAETDSGRDFALARYTPDGLLDHSFGLGGIVVTEYGSLDDELTALAVDDEGRLVVAGYTSGTSGRAVIIARYLTSGSLDPAFGDQGISLIGVGEDALARSIAVDTEGRIVVAGSFLHRNRAEVMVLRLTTDGELDATFGIDGLAAPQAVDIATDGFAVALHDSGAILVAGAVGVPGTLDTALFKFTDQGQPDPSFGDNGILVTEASQEDDVALALAVRGNKISLSGYTTVNGVREFLFIYHELDQAVPTPVNLSGRVRPYLATSQEGGQPSSPPVNILIQARRYMHGDQETVSPAAEAVSFDLKGKNGRTGLRIGQRQDKYSYSLYEGGTASLSSPPPVQLGQSNKLPAQAPYRGEDQEGLSAYPVQTVVNSTQFGASEDISYAVAMQADGKVVAAGLTEQGGTTSFAVARYAVTSSAAANADVAWIVTKEPSEVTRTGAFTGGAIGQNSPNISQRGVVYSIAPDPVLDEGTGTTDDPPDDTDTTPPTVSSTNPANGATNVALNSDVTITWSEGISCSSVSTSSVTSTSPSWNRKSCIGSQAVFETSGQAAGTEYTVNVTTAVTDVAGNEMSSAYSFSFTTAAASAGVLPRANYYADALGNLLVSTAYAQTNTTGTGQTSTTSNTTTYSSGVFDLSKPEYSLDGYTKDGAGSGSYSSILNKLRPGTYYYVRAYAKTSSGEVYYGNQTGFKTAEACFIATAAYGSLFHPYVRLLREFRDQYLLTSQPGELFVKLYYRHSPPMADYISSHPVLRPVVQAALLPVVGLSWLLLHLGAPGLLLLGGVAGLIGWQTRRFSLMESAN